MKVITNEGSKPVYLWLEPEKLDGPTVEQIIHLADLPFAFHHIAIMPDAHAGYGMPIGGVLATEGVVIPNAVGVDIGCGMVAIQTNLKVPEKSILEQIVKDIKKIIPVGFAHHQKPQDKSLMPDLEIGEVSIEQYEAALFQLGTLGGGNHFIELQKDKNNNLWIMLHSGSRNFGYKIAQYYNNKAIELNAKWYSTVPKEWQLAFLPLDSDESKLYMEDMNYAVEFAKANRKLMMDRILETISNYIPELEVVQRINIPHNYVRMENHYRHNVMVHRKGATSARKGEMGIIPGAMGRSSYIVRGLGNKKSFNSCSHGAGRILGRKQAKRELDLKKEKKILDDQNIIHSLTEQNKLDEAPDAYKDIEVVIQNELDLIEPVVKLNAVAVIKG